MSGPAQKTVTTLDVINGPDNTGPQGAVRLSRSSSGLQISVDGGAPSAIGGGGGTVASVVAGTGIAVNSADPANPIVSASGTTVVTDGITIQGNGTSGSKIAQKPSAALTPDPRGYFAALFQQMTSLSPLLFWSHASDFLDYNQAVTGAGGMGAITPSGTGANASKGAANGILVLAGPTSGAGSADWAQTPGGSNQQIGNGRTKRWLLAYRTAVGHAPAAASRVAFGLYTSTTMVGLGYGSAAANWQYCRATNNVVSVADTGTAIDSSGAVFIWMYLYNDGTNINYCVDVSGGGVQTIAEASTNIPSATSYMYIWNEGTGASDSNNFDGYVFCCER